VIVGIVPQMTDLRLGCTPPVLAAMDGLVDMVVAELRAHGFVPLRREQPIGPHDDGARALGL
jgi:hypothetical protein